MHVSQVEPILDILGAPMHDTAGAPMVITRHASRDDSGWSSDDASFALWLNATFQHTADRAALTADLDAHGLVVSDRDA